MRVRNRATIYDVARLAGVSTATVSRMVNGKGQISDATREAIRAAIAQLNYQPNSLARSLVTRSTQTIAFLLTDLANPFNAELVMAAQARALGAGHTMLLCLTDGDSTQEQTVLSMLRGKQVDGALVGGLALSSERIGWFVQDGFPIVCLDRDVDSTAVPLVHVDNQKGAQMATEHLIQLGHRRIANLSGVVDHLNSRIGRERVAGYRTALRDAGLEIHSELEVPGALTMDGGYVATQSLLGEDFTAVFAGNDLAALGAIRALHEAGLRVPEDVSVVGFDDIDLIRFVSPPLTTVRQPAADIAARAIEILLELIRGGAVTEMDYVTEPQLCIRESSGPPASAR